MSSSDANVKKFDEAAKDWDEKPARIDLARDVALTIFDHIPLGKWMRVLEYGCGTGLLTLRLAERVKEIWAVDSSKGMLEVLETKVKNQAVDNVHPVFGDFTKEVSFSDRFDLIVSSMTLHHIKDVTSLLETFYLLLNPGGFLAVADLEKEDGSFHDKNAPGVMHHGFDKAELSSVLSELGFSNIEFATAHEIKKEQDKGNFKTYPVFLMVAQKPN